MTVSLSTSLLAASLFIVAAAPSAWAQELDPTAKPGRPLRIDGVCSDQIARFCPALAEGPGQTRNQVTCLKPYRSSLPLACRRAVSAALK